MLFYFFGLCWAYEFFDSVYILEIHTPFLPIKPETQAGFFFISNQQKAMFNKMLTLSLILCQLFPRVSRSREASISE